MRSLNARDLDTGARGRFLNLLRVNTDSVLRFYGIISKAREAMAVRPQRSGPGAAPRAAGFAPAPVPSGAGGPELVLQQLDCGVVGGVPLLAGLP